jgi:BolA protein
MKEHLLKQLKVTFNPIFLEVTNESHNHSGNASESHFKIIIVSDEFEGLTLINRHRKINTLFKEELQSIHALAMHTYTPSEWQKKGGAPASPKCHGG